MVILPAFVVDGWLAANGNPQLSQDTMRLILADESLKPFYWTPSDAIDAEQWNDEEEI